MPFCIEICGIIIAELSGDAEMPTRTEGCQNGSQGQRIGAEKI